MITRIRRSSCAGNPKLRARLTSFSQNFAESSSRSTCTCGGSPGSWLYQKKRYGPSFSTVGSFDSLSDAPNAQHQRRSEATSVACSCSTTPWRASLEHTPPRHAGARLAEGAPSEPMYAQPRNLSSTWHAASVGTKWLPATGMTKRLLPLVEHWSHR